MKYKREIAGDDSFLLFLCAFLQSNIFLVFVLYAGEADAILIYITCPEQAFCSIDMGRNRKVLEWNYWKD